MFNYSPIPLIIDSVNEELALCPDILEEQPRTIILEYTSQEMSNISDADKIHKILKGIKSLNTLDIDFIIVSENILTDDDYIGITLIPHIRYTKFATNETISKLPIIILTEDTIDADFYKNRFKYANFLLSGGVEIITVGSNPQATSDNIPRRHLNSLER
ncbi:MAG: hypothetical protein IPN94_00175 [Sphingobacteriales bacterium]|nr:hypothetical protein [Sphingobacteriales bacterium]